MSQVRLGRLTAFTGAAVVTLTTALGGLGVLPDGGHRSYAAATTASGEESAGAITLDSAPVGRPSAAVSPRKAKAVAGKRSPVTRARPEALVAPSPKASASVAADLSPPAGSGHGRRVVFDQSDQRVWLVEADGTVARSYLVSGSVYDNLDPGAYEVYSRSENAVGIDDSGTMRWMVRFTTGDSAAIGFHDIPVDDGARVQTRAQLGTPLSHGCIRQWRPDARALWDFAPLGTPVVVTA